MRDTRPAALIVGATGAIGQAISAVVVEHGYRVSLAGRSADRAHELARRVDPAGEDSQALTADLLDPAGPAGLVTAHLDRFERLDLVVNAAGVSQRRPLAEVDIRRSRTLLEVNLVATVALLAAALPPLRTTARERPGAQVVLLSSVVAGRPVGGFGLYSATKAAVSSLVRSVNEEENVLGVRATALCPGFVDSSFTAGVERDDGAFLPPADIAEAVRFLLRLSSGARVPELEIGRTKAEVGRP